MSYCRFAEADVYVYMDTRGYLACCGCILTDRWEYQSTTEMVAHLREHIDVGHSVPDWVIPSIEADDDENFPAAVEGGGYTP